MKPASRLAYGAALFLLVHSATILHGQSETAIVHDELGFRLEAPAPGWRLLDTAAVRRVQPRAAAGAVSPDGVYGVVVVERAPDQPLVDIGRALVRSSTLEDVEVELFEGMELGGRPAVHWTLRGKTNGTTYLHDITLLECDGRLFRLVAWSSNEGSAGAAHDFRDFVGSFSLLQRAADSLPVSDVMPDAQGRGWRLQRGIWQGPPSGLQVVPRGGWRVLAGEELWNLNTRATVGLWHEGSRATVLVFAGRWAEQEQDEWRRFARADSDDLGEPLNEALLVTLDGTETELRMFTAHNSGDGGERIRELAGELARDETCLEFLAWYPVTNEGDALAALHSGFASIHFMDDVARAAATRELSASGSLPNEVGDGFSLRQGTYRDFRFGLHWTPPGNGWDVTVGENADLDEAGAVLTLRSAALGVRGALFASPVSSVPRENWHELALSKASDGRSTRRIGDTRTIVLGEVQALVSITEPTGVRPARTWIVTAENSSWAFELHLRGSPSVVGRESATMEGLLASLAIAESASPPTSTTPRAHYDDRIGFQLASPGEGYEFSTDGAERFWPAGTIARWSNGERELALLALCGARFDDGIDFHASLARNSLGLELGPVLSGTPTVETLTFDGYEARELAWRTTETDVRTWVFERDRTLFLVHMVEPSQTLARTEIEALFELLP